MSGPWREDERVVDYLKARPELFGPKIKTETHQSGGMQYVCVCPFCHEKGKFYISAETSKWDCKRGCGNGNLTTLKRALGDILAIDRSTGREPAVEGDGLRWRGNSGGGGGRRAREGRGGGSDGGAAATAPVAGGAGPRSTFTPGTGALGGKRVPEQGTAEVYHARLMARADEGALAAWDWLTNPAGKRCYTEEAIREFKLGVCELPCFGDDTIRDKLEELKGGGKRGGGGRRARGVTIDHCRDGEGEGGVCKVCGGKPDVCYVSVPFFDRAGKLINFKYRSVPPWPKHWRRFYGGESSLLHLQTLDLGEPGDEAKRPDGTQYPVILVEGEWDVMAMRCMGYFNVTTVPTGASGRLQDTWADQLAKVQAFLICYDSDGVGRMGAERMAVEIGRHRCWLATLPDKDANECYRKGNVDDVAEALAHPESFAPSLLVESSDVREKVRQRIMNPEMYYGISTGWKSLDALWGGLRPEMTVFTAHSGSGKTTFTTALAGNLASRGVPGLMCPFETGVDKGVIKLLWRIAGCDIGTPAGLSKYDESFDILEGWPLYWIRHKGQLPLLTLKETIYYAATRLGIRWVIIDHLDYFIHPEKGEDEWVCIKRTLREITNWSDELSLWIGVVVHPTGKPIDETVRVQMTDLRGGAASWQIPGSILGLHRPRTKSRGTTKKQKENGPCVIVYTLKVRDEVGSEGEAVLDFIPSCQSFRDPADDPEVEELP